MFGFELGGIANRGITKNCMYVLLISCVYFYFFCLLSNQLNSGYHATGSSGGLPGGQITLSIQKVVVKNVLT